MTNVTAINENLMDLDSDTDNEPNITADKFDVRKHNGIVTISKPSTGEHRTIRIATVKSKKSPLHGKRIVGLLTGPNNKTDYTNFGFASSQGVSAWFKKRGTNGKKSTWEKLARAIANPAASMAHGFIFQVSANCTKCNRLLTDPESLASGMGPICRGDQ